MAGKKRRPGIIKKLALLFISIGMISSGFLLLWAATLQVPDLTTFNERKITQSTKIYDRTGEILLYDIHKDVQRTVVPFDEISRHIKNATVAIEDAAFYEHLGVRPLATFRAVIIQPLRGKGVQGGSTITQQVVKNSLLTSEKKIARKLKEWILALKLEKVASKESILELYLNEVPYGGNVYGIEEASKAFFDKSAHELTLAESAYLAALPQAPTYYSPYGNNKDKLEERKNLVLFRMKELNFLSEEDYNAAKDEVVTFQPQAQFGIRAPHFVFYIREQIENKYGKDFVEKGGLRVITTLDYNLQEKAEATIKEFAESNEKNFNAKNAGLTAVDPKTGDILTMVGSRDYFEVENDGNFNVTLGKRQPGSSFKPFVYATALSKGYTPETVVFDLETQFHSGCDTFGKPLYESVKEEECYMPSNYDDIFRGPVTFRNALAQSINIPAIKVLYLAGVQDSLDTAHAMGITTLTDPSRYGLTLVLGGGEVTLLEMTGAYSVFANNGVRNHLTSILSIEDTRGNILEQAVRNPERVIEEEVALKINNMLSDNEARTPAFGEQSYLYFPERDVAAKTGTTNDYKDAWIVGYTPNIAVGAWAGNNDNTPMEKKVAGFIIAPLWNAFMKEAFKEFPQEEFKQPEKETDMSLKPILRGEWRGGESYFIDTISGNLATEYTPLETKQERFITNVHSILYWVNRLDPTGEKPEYPDRDSQFSLWEEPVRKWVQEQNIQEGETTIPHESDQIHKPEYSPVLTIKNFDESLSYPMTDSIRLEVEATGKFGVQKIDLFVNGRYINSAKVKPFLFSFVPNDIDSIQNENELRLVGYDSVFNKGEKIITLRIHP